jgi:hypothetical protein
MVLLDLGKILLWWGLIVGQSGAPTTLTPWETCFPVGGTASIAPPELTLWPPYSVSTWVLGGAMHWGDSLRWLSIPIPLVYMQFNLFLLCMFWLYLFYFSETFKISFSCGNLHQDIWIYSLKRSDSMYTGLDHIIR